MERSFIVSIAVSLILHASLFFIVLNREPEPEIPQPQTVQIKLDGDSQEDPKSRDFMEMGTGMIACPNSYVGVGFKYRFLDQEITDVSPDSPAERMGLQRGDIIIKMTDSILTQVGQDFSITISRGKQQLTFSSKAEDICTQ